MSGWTLKGDSLCFDMFGARSARANPTGGRFRLCGIVCGVRHLYMSNIVAFDAHEKLIAHGTSTLMTLPDKGLRVGIPKFLAT